MKTAVVHDYDSMYFWNTKALADDLRRAPAAPGKWLRYLSAWAVLLTVLIANFLTYEPSPSITAPAAIGDLCLLTAAVALLWRANKQGDGRDFVTRLVCLAWPEVLKTILALTMVVLALHSFNGALTRPLFGIVLEITILGGLVACTWRLHKYMRYVSKAGEESTDQ
jgi:F0F1-type ATP synthase assembly protein I